MNMKVTIVFRELFCVSGVNLFQSTGPVSIAVFIPCQNLLIEFTLDHTGPMARTVQDTALMLEVGLKLCSDLSLQIFTKM